MIDLSTTYLGLTLKSPIVCSSSPLCQHLPNFHAMQQAGAGAIVLHSLFEEQIELASLDLQSFLSGGPGNYLESLGYLPEMGTYNLGPEGYVEHIRRAKDMVDIPVIGSLNAKSVGGWARYAKIIQDAGADALELNIYRIPTGKSITSAQVERELIHVVRAVAAEIDIPLAVKLGPQYTALPSLAEQINDAGADALVLFNRFYQPNFDIVTLEVKPSLQLSDPSELLLRLHWVAILFEEIPVDLAITGGVHSAQDLIKSIMAGASAVMTTSALLENGISYIETMLGDLRKWMEEHQYDTIQKMRGMLSLRRVGDPAAFERGNYLKVLRSYSVKRS